MGCEHLRCNLDGYYYCQWKYERKLLGLIDIDDKCDTTDCPKTKKLEI